MSAVQRLQAAFVNASQETTLALANVNADFSLVKIEPRVEYREIGGTLSKRRRADGEAGPIHVTARRLGTLFQSIIPEVPNLIKAYGERASELSKSPEANPKGSDEHGPFKEFVGLDGASLWAAATSGDAALAVHLLACMLAAHWPPAEAIAIWVELVAERKRQLEDTATNNSIQDVVASQLVISQEALEGWDTSARSWLKATNDDPLICNQQQGVMKVLRGLRLNVSGSSDVYRSVTDAWKLALETFDKIIAGASYNILEGAVLLALSSWHLYPDLVVLGNQKQEIHQNDRLVQAGGIVTIGVTLPDADGPVGVRWLLSLSHLKYYGSPVMVTGATQLDDGRLNFDEFMVVSLGAIIGLWNSDSYITTENAVQLISLFIKRTEEVVREICDEEMAKLLLDRTWISPFKKTIARLNYGGKQDENAIRDVETEKLLKLGQRRCQFISGATDTGPPITTTLFGLESPNLGNLLKDEEARIDFYRSIAQRYEAAQTKTVFLLRVVRITPSGPFTYVCTGTPFYGKHYRWVAGGIQVDAPTEIVAPLDPSDLYYREQPYDNEDSWVMWCSPPKILKRVCRTKGKKMRKRSPRSQGYDSEDFDDSSIIRYKRQYTIDQNARDGEEIIGYEFHRVNGRDSAKEELVTMFSLGSLQDEDSYVPHLLSPTRKLILQVLRTEKLRPSEYIRFSADSYFLRYLRFFSACWAIYRDNPSTAISPNILSRESSLLRDYETLDPLPPGPLLLPSAQGERSGEAGEVEKLRRLLQGNSTPEASFALLYALETGSVHFQRDKLKGVFAMSNEDSLYISAQLLSDPATTTSGGPLIDIRRVKGNIGRSGTAFLIGPSDTRVRKSDPSHWRMVNHLDFDGKLEDAFQDINLILRLTGYELPIDTGRRGYQFTEAFLAEAVVSVHARGDWVSDLNMESLYSKYFRRVQPLLSCNPQMPGGRPDYDLVSVENWEELLDPPSVPGVFKAYGNWQARLAAVCMSVQLGYQTFLFGSHGCWDCATEAFYRWRAGQGGFNQARPPRPPPWGLNITKSGEESEEAWETDTASEVSDEPSIASKDDVESDLDNEKEMDGTSSRPMLSKGSTLVEGKAESRSCRRVHSSSRVSPPAASAARPGVIAPLTRPALPAWKMPGGHMPGPPGSRRVGNTGEGRPIIFIL